ncbi:MAG: metallophosphoesterase [Thermoplasmata archaeon]|nr:metallophosphoesterase [Thermoplasmata archaeon]
MRDHLVAFFESHHRLVEADALRLLLESPEPLLLSRRLVESTPPDATFVTREMVELLVVHGASLSGAHLRVAGSSPSASPLGVARSIAPPPMFTLLSEGFVPTARRRNALEEYEELFRSRYRALHRMLRGRPDLPNLRPMKELAGVHGTASVIVMLREIRRTAAKGHLILSVEDETGGGEVLVPRDTPAGRLSLVPDEVVGLRLYLGREKKRIARVEAIERPDVASNRSMRRADSPSHALFLSDLHIGSKSFMTEPWDRLMGFLRGDGPRPDLALAIDHVVIAGDLVDGIGIYPNQERDLGIGDIVEQYTELGRRLRELPERLNIVVLPGNHDAVAPSEPQPSLPKELLKVLPDRVRSVGNPSTFALNGVVVQAYHGRSFDDLIPAIPGASYERPTDVMKLMLKMRHLGPIYGGRMPVTPQSRDGLLIDPAPEILVTGHAHTFGVDEYRGTLLLNASTWQAETEYQRMRNITPVPARAAVVDLASMVTTAIDCSGDETAVGGSPA